MAENRYIDTRGNVTEPVSFRQAVVDGLADGGGLYVPETIPTMTVEEIIALADLPYAQRAAAIYKRFDVDFADETVDRIMAGAYSTNFDNEAICPITSLDENTHVLELWHGPTSAFKDMALQCLPRCFAQSAAELRAVHEPFVDRRDLAVARERRPHNRLVVVAERNVDPAPDSDVRSPVLQVQPLDDPRHVVDLHERTLLQSHVLPDAAHGKMRHDVPAVHVRRLAEVLVVGAAGHGSAQFAKRDLPRLKPHWAYQHRHSVRLPVLQRPRHVELVADEHVLRRADLRTVEEDVRQRVDAVEHEKMA